MDYRIRWNDYFMDIAEVVSKRSLDPNSKWGCLAVSKENSILSTGYNSPPRHIDDSLVPLTRPDKYTYMEHAERNCIYNAARTGNPLDGCTFYVTGVSCIDCFRAMYQVGASRIVMKTVESASCNEEWFEFIEFMQKYIKVEWM